MSARPEPTAVDPRVGQRYVGSPEHPLLRPKDAASIILMDRSGPKLRFLVGKRGKAHAFMPELYVFPGGRRDTADSRVPVATPLREEVEAKLLVQAGAAMTPPRARALAVAAIRETMEETGLILGAAGDVGSRAEWQPFRAREEAPDLSALRYIARATTPPRQSRRFDTRFFACFLDEVGADPATMRDSPELHDLSWIGFDDMGALPLPRITRIVLSDLRAELAADPTLPFGRPVPFYSVRRGIFDRVVL
jgi:8-oxo-dGTP pyrophosphatase MutT (NUDIX family)